MNTNTNPQSTHHVSNITIKDQSYKFNLEIYDEQLNISITNNQLKSTFYNSYSSAEISSMTREADFPSTMAQLYEMLIASATSNEEKDEKEKINLDLNITMQNTENKQEQKMVLELILTLDGKLNRVYKYVFELANVKRHTSEILDEVLKDSVKLSDRVSQLEKLLETDRIRIAKLEKLLETNSNLLETNNKSKETLSGHEHEPDSSDQEFLEKANNGFRWNCENGQLTVAKWLYSRGNVNIHANNEHAFQLSCKNGHLAVAQWLYSLGNVDIHVSDKYAFKYSCKNGHLAVAKWLYSLGNIYTDRASKKSPTEVLRWLITITK